MKNSKRRFLKNKQGKCAFCGSVKKLTIDHIIPKSKGGSGRYKNLQVLCKDCNVNKGNKVYPQQTVAVNNN